MSRLLRAVAVLFLLAASAFAQSVPYTPYPTPKNLNEQLIILSLQAINDGTGTCTSYTNATGCAKGPGSILVIGDSITNQLFQSYSACGYNILFFGVNGVEAHDILPNVNQIISSTLPQVIVLALGKNDMVDPNLNYTDWEEDYYWLVQYIEDATQRYEGKIVKPVIMTILPPERQSPTPWNNIPLLDQYNGYLVSNPPSDGNNIVSIFGLPFVDFSNPPSGVTPIVTDGPYLTPGFTWPGDGYYIHPVGSNNTLLWQYYKSAIADGLAEEGQSCNSGAPPVAPP